MIHDDSALFHEAPYDPQKAREYYLRTRKLKGRHKGAVELPAKGRSGGSSQPSRHPRVAKKSPQQKRKEAEVQVAALKKRLERLKEVLEALVKAAKARSGVKETPKEKASRNTSDKGRKPLTAKQKRDAAKRSKENYEKNKTPEQELKELRSQIKDIRAKIQAALDEAKKNKKHRPNSKTASKGR